MIIAIIGLIANLLAIFGVYMEAYSSYDSVYETLFNVLMISWGISIFGLFLVLLNQKKIGAILIIIGSIPFVPLGLIAIFGGSRLLQSMKDSDLVARRKALNSRQIPEHKASLVEIVSKRK